MRFFIWKREKNSMVNTVASALVQIEEKKYEQVFVEKGIIKEKIEFHNHL